MKKMPPDQSASNPNNDEISTSEVTVVDLTAQSDSDSDEVESVTNDGYELLPQDANNAVPIENVASDNENVVEEEQEIVGQQWATFQPSEPTFQRSWDETVAVSAESEAQRREAVPMSEGE